MLDTFKLILGNPDSTKQKIKDTLSSNLIKGSTNLDQNDINSIFDLVFTNKTATESLIELIDDANNAAIITRDFFEKVRNYRFSLKDTHNVLRGQQIDTHERLREIEAIEREHAELTLQLQDEGKGLRAQQEQIKARLNDIDNSISTIQSIIDKQDTPPTADPAQLQIPAGRFTYFEKVLSTLSENRRTQAEKLKQIEEQLKAALERHQLLEQSIKQRKELLKLAERIGDHIDLTNDKLEAVTRAERKIEQRLPAPRRAMAFR